jgi:hypothetical protein
MTKTHQVIILFSGFALFTLTASLASVLVSSWSH